MSNKKKILYQTLKVLGIFAGVIVLSMLSAYHFARIHNLFQNLGIESYGGWIGTDESWYFIFGLFDAFPFWAGLLFLTLLNKNRLLIALLFSLPVPIFFLMGGGQLLQYSLAIAIFALVGLALGQLIYLARKRFVKR